ncbi:uncharacterized protein LOC129589967 [Paramacrobiotus metropolitanus]|uniref:uncharacterized protein LOC129589967 n=1 Tax=Paramacrobiotus metropolitanus TaxID=2943436 RepID=UPI0024464E30|nr:uncharacterized protein LOC129589967 [Paramacrobiotus metropolitanus]
MPGTLLQLWPVCMWFLAVQVQGHVHITNGIQNSSRPVLSNSDALSLPNRHFENGHEQSLSIMFYLKQKDTPSDQQYIYWLEEFKWLLPLPRHMGLHGVAIYSTNLSVPQIEDALNYAWAEAFKQYTSSPSSVLTDAPHVRLMSIVNSAVPSKSRSSVARIIYTVVMSNDSHQAKANAGPATTNIRIRKMIPPTKDELKQKLQEKGVNVYNETVLPILPAIGSSPPACHIHLGEAGTNIPIVTEATGAEPTAPRFDGGFSPTRRLNCEEVFIKPKADSLSSTNNDQKDAPLRTTDPDWSFRLFYSEPVNLQNLPNLQRQIVQTLETALDKQTQSIVVALWNPDVDNGTAINFFIRLINRYQQYIDLDSRMLYADAIYKRLEGAKYIAHRVLSKLSRVRLAGEPDLISEKFLMDCKEGRKLRDRNDMPCPLRPTFALHYLLRPNETLSNETVLYNVTRDFADANPLSLSGVEYHISLVNRTQLAHFQTLRGYTLTRCDMTFTVSNLRRGRIEHIWRFPRTLPAYEPNNSFRVFPTTPMNYQLLPVFEDTIKEYVNSFRSADQDVHIWNPDLTGNVVDFFIELTESAIFNNGPGFVDPSSHFGKLMYSQICRSMKLTSRFSDVPVVMMKFSCQNTSCANNQSPEQCITQSTPKRSPLPSTFSLHLMKIENIKNGQPHDGPDLNIDAVLHAVGNAFSAANPLTIDDLSLNITLTGHSDDYMTPEGKTVEEFNFTLTHRETSSRKYWNLWRFPDRSVMGSFLRNNASAVVVGA